MIQKIMKIIIVKNDIITNICMERHNSCVYNTFLNVSYLHK